MMADRRPRVYWAKVVSTKVVSTNVVAGRSILQPDRSTGWRAYARPTALPFTRLWLLEVRRRIAALL
jgi:hypothetical protein